MDPIRGLDGLPLSLELPSATPAAAGPSFSEVLGGAIGKVDALQYGAAAKAAARKLAILRYAASDGQG